MECYLCSAYTNHKIKAGPICIDCLLEEHRDLTNGYAVLSDRLKTITKIIKEHGCDDSADWIRLRKVIPNIFEGKIQKRSNRE